MTDREVLKGYVDNLIIKVEDSMEDFNIEDVNEDVKGEGNKLFDKLFELLSEVE